MTTNHALIRNRLELLAEIVAIGCDLSVCERMFGTRADIADLQRRQRRVCLDVLMQLFAYLSVDTKATN